MKSSRLTLRWAKYWKQHTDNVITHVICPYCNTENVGGVRRPIHTCHNCRKTMILAEDISDKRY